MLGLPNIMYSLAVGELWVEKGGVPEGDVLVDEVLVQVAVQGGNSGGSLIAGLAQSR